MFDWAAYHDVWGDTPVHSAVTSMFAEYAVLFSRIAGRTTSAVPPPMTMTEGRKIAEQAQDFVNNFVTPILGHIASVKVHKLLCHVADAIKWHGNLRNGNTANNESEHKIDKPFYARANNDVRTFTRQLFCHLHGARTILARHADADKAAVTPWQVELAERASTAAAAAATQGTAGGAPTAGGHRTAAAGAAAGAAPAREGGAEVSAAAAAPVTTAGDGEAATVAAADGGVAVEAAAAAAASAAAAAAATAAAERALKQKLRV